VPCSQPEVRTVVPGGHIEEDADRARSHLRERGGCVSPGPAAGQFPVLLREIPVRPTSSHRSKQEGDPYSIATP